MSGTCMNMLMVKILQHGNLPINCQHSTRNCPYCAWLRHPPPMSALELRGPKEPCTDKIHPLKLHNKQGMGFKFNTTLCPPLSAAVQKGFLPRKRLYLTSPVHVCHWRTRGKEGEGGRGSICYPIQSVISLSHMARRHAWTIGLISGSGGRRDICFRVLIWY